MDNFKEQVEKAKIGSVVPIFKVVDGIPDPVEYFAKLSDYGRKKNSILLQSADIVAKYGEKSLGTANPCLKLTGSKEEFEIKALNKLGETILKLLKPELKFCDKLTYQNNTIKGILKPKRRAVNEEERLRLKTHMDIIRAIVFKFSPTEKPQIPYCGLFGSISYDFIDQFEDLPPNTADELNDPDYELYLVDNLFLMDHKENKTYFIANAFITDKNKGNVFQDCINTIETYEKKLTEKCPKPKKFKKL